MSLTTIGKYVDDGPFTIDINRLISTRLVVQASSGGGKSYLLRKLIEECHGKVQTIVLDIEGEFSTLREKFDFIVAGKGGDIACEPRSAALLARKVLELKTDIICDLYELKQHQRIEFVRNFLDAMVNSPKELWHPVLVILDEAHIFAPEKSHAESLSAVVDMESRGRKRGFCLVVATQRPAKIDKDVVAECQNKLIGLGNTDADRERGAKELGFTDKKLILSMRDLEQGQFFAVGPAFSKRGANLVKVGKVSTTHPDSGSGRVQIHTPPPTTKVKSILAKLTDLPKEAEEELRDVQALRARVRVLERELKAKPHAEDPKAIEASYKKGFEQARREMKAELAKSTSILVKIKPHALAMIKALEHTPGKIEYLPPTRNIFQTRAAPRNISQPKPEPIANGHDTEDNAFGLCERKILGFLNLNPGEYFTKVQVGAMTGYSHGSGGFNNALSKLGQAGLILRQGGSIALNPDADVSGLVDAQPHTLKDWIAKLGKCERELYQVMLENPDQSFSKQEIAEITNYSAGSGGFNNALSRLNTLGLVRRHPDGRIGINPELMEVA
jgi:hypothetical protein